MSILPLSQQRLWPDLHAAAELRFVLYGGTAISLRCGHRISKDVKQTLVNAVKLVNRLPDVTIISKILSDYIPQ
jgi:hypothetical protein